MGWMAPRNGGYQPKDNGKPQGLPPKGGAGIGTQRRNDMSDENTRQVKRQIELFLEDGNRTRLIVALAIIEDAASGKAFNFFAGANTQQ